jgi:diguanylate cyclase (GGDEF)-like protein
MPGFRTLLSWLSWAGAAAKGTPAAGRRPVTASAIVDPVPSDAAVSAVVEVLSRSIEARSHWAGSDLRRVRRHAVALARRARLGPADVEAVGIAAVLQDIGMLAVPPHILAKPGPLTTEELDRVRTHPETAARMLAAVPFRVPVVPLIEAHHERWDGRGYPRGLAGEAIPAGARVLAATGCYDALRSPRPHRAALSMEGARDVLAAESGKALDPRLVSLYLEALPALDREDEAERLATANDATAPWLAGIAQAQRESAVLFELSQALATTLGVEDTIQALLARLGELVPYEGAAVFLAGDDGLLRCVAARGLDAKSLRILPLDDDQAAPAMAVRHAQTILNADPIREVLAAQEASGQRWRNSLATPLVAGGRAFGALVLYSWTSKGFTQAQASTLERAARHAAVAIANARRFDRAQTDSLTDALTDLPNARFMMRHLAQELARATRVGSQLSLLIVDVDDFKRINDTAGHHVGDRVLREVGRVLRTSVRAYDVCARYAGDEFLVLLPECGADAIAERLTGLEAVLNRITVAAGERLLRIRASVGAAVFPADGDSFEALLASADRRMYEHKALSRVPGRSAPAPRPNHGSLAAGEDSSPTGD